jgi:hypothetical protein
MADAPGSLRERMRMAVLETTALTGQPRPDRLMAAAMVCLRSALALGNTRPAAAALLAADALITAACEAAVEDGAELDAFARAASAQLAALLPAGNP